MLNAGLQSAIKTAIVSGLAPLRVTDIAVLEETDYASNDVIFITINLPAGTGPIPGDRILQAMSLVSQRLLEAGDEREPHFRTVREGEVEPVDEDAGALP